MFGVDPAVDDVPRWRPGVTLLQPPAMFLLLVSVSGIVTNGICRPYIVKGRTSCQACFSGHQGFQIAVEKPVVYVDLL